MRISRRGELVAKVLHTIANASIAFARHPSRNSLSVYRALREFAELQNVTDRQLRTISRYIIGKQYVSVARSRSGDVEISITAAGRTLVDREALMHLKPRPQAVWDKKWRLVMFDIPTEMKYTRDAFCGVLKRIGFIHYQKSVFICPHPCEEELEIIAEYFGIADCVDIVVAAKIMRDVEYRTAFKL